MPIIKSVFTIAQEKLMLEAAENHIADGCEVVNLVGADYDTIAQAIFDAFQIGAKWAAQQCLHSDAPLAPESEK